MLTHLRLAGRQLAQSVPANVRFKLYVGTTVIGGGLVALGKLTDVEVSGAVEVVAEILAIGSPVLAAGNVPKER